MNLGLRVSCLLAGCVALSCGARSGLEVAPPAEPCGVDVDCVDAFPCTADQCDPIRHVCLHAPQHSACDDGIFCNGDERCDVGVGCVNVPRDCSDAAECTIDVCDEAGLRCEHRVDDSVCPVNHACDPEFDCEPRAFAHDAATLYEVRLMSGRVSAIGGTVGLLADIAPSRNNDFYGLTDTALHTISANTGAAVREVPLASPGLNAADVDPATGVLYAAGAAGLYTLDPQSGIATFVMAFPPGWSSSGDLAFLDGRLVGSARQTGQDSLIAFDLDRGISTVVGMTGYTCVWGLVAYGPKLFGFTCEGRILSLDTATGAGTELHRGGVGFRGASTPPAH